MFCWTSASDISSILRKLAAAELTAVTLLLDSATDLMAESVIEKSERLGLAETPVKFMVDTELARLVDIWLEGLAELSNKLTPLWEMLSIELAPVADVMTLDVSLMTRPFELGAIELEGELAKVRLDCEEALMPLPL